MTQQRARILAIASPIFIVLTILVVCRDAAAQQEGNEPCDGQLARTRLHRPEWRPMSHNGPRHLNRADPGQESCRSTPNKDNDVCLKLTDSYGKSKTLTATNMACAEDLINNLDDVKASYCHDGKCNKDSFKFCVRRY